MKTAILGNNKEKIQEISKALVELNIDQMEAFSSARALIGEGSRESLFDAVFVLADDYKDKLEEEIENLKEFNPDNNIILIADSEEYCMLGYRLRVSGYIIMPVTNEKISFELSNLRYSISKDAPVNIDVRTAGIFDIFVNNNVVCFGRKPAKELLAILIDSNGSSLTRKEIAEKLFDDREYSRNTQSYITQIIKTLKETLREYGIEEILISEKNTYAIDMSKLNSDFNANRRNSNSKEYMSQYSWGTKYEEK